MQKNFKSYLKLFTSTFTLSAFTFGGGYVIVPLMRKAVRTLADDAAAVWLFALPNPVITKATVTGVPQNSATLSFDLAPIAIR